MDQRSKAMYVTNGTHAQKLFVFLALLFVQIQHLRHLVVFNYFAFSLSARQLSLLPTRPASTLLVRKQSLIFALPAHTSPRATPLAS